MRNGSWAQFSLFLCAGVARDLHSFPTRRSSDLFAAEFSSEADWKKQTHRLGARLHPLTIEQNALTSLDRKSTRLNSSHSQIAYAVFCLKKKKRLGLSDRVPTTMLCCARAAGGEA